MKRILNDMSIFAKIRTFIEETMDEMRKCNWPSRDQLLESTLLVLVTLVILAAYIAGIDQILLVVIKFLTSF